MTPRYVCLFECPRMTVKRAVFDTAFLACSGFSPRMVPLKRASALSLPLGMTGRSQIAEIQRSSHLHAPSHLRADNDALSIRNTYQLPRSSNDVPSSVLGYGSVSTAICSTCGPHCSSVADLKDRSVRNSFEDHASFELEWQARGRGQV